MLRLRQAKANALPQQIGETLLFILPQSLAFGANGELYLADAGAGRIYVLRLMSNGASPTTAAPPAMAPRPTNPPPATTPRRTPAQAEQKPACAARRGQTQAPHRHRGQPPQNRRVAPPVPHRPDYAAGEARAATAIARPPV